MHKISTKSLILQISIIFILTASFTVYGGIENVYLYVSPSGTDNPDNGSESKPYKTISYALENLIQGQHYTIYLDSGEYIIKDQIELPVQVDLIGSGIDKTILKAAPGFYRPDPDGGYENVLIYLFKGVGKQEIAHFTIDGDNKQLFAGLGIRVREKVYVHDLYVKDTFYAGIFMSGPSNSVFHSIKLENCAWGSTEYCSGALNMGYHIKNTDFHDFEIIEGINNPSDEWGYAVKHQGTGVDLRNIRFFNSTFNINPIGLWNDGGAPNIALEYWKSSLYDCEIFNCHTNANLSLVESASLPEDYEHYPIRVYRNTFVECASHAIEAALDNIEIDQNFFTNSKFTIVSYNPESNYKNWNIHHNIFTDNKDITEVSFVRNKGRLSNLTFANNTCYITNSADMPIVRVESKESANINIINNILYKDYNTTPENIFKTLNDANFDSITINNNLLYNYEIPDWENCVSNNNITGELPCLKLSGKKPLPYFQPNNNSKIIDAGMNLNYPFNGNNNDIGAHEMVVGTGTIPSVSLYATVDTTSSILNLHVEATDSVHGIGKIEVYADKYLLDAIDASTLIGSYELDTDTTYLLKAFAYNKSGYLQAAYSTINKVEMITGIKRFTTNEPLNIYPNPANERIVVEMKGNIPIDYISVYNTKGELVIRKEDLSNAGNTVEINTDNLSNGLYMIITSLNDRNKIINKIVIE